MKLKLYIFIFAVLAVLMPVFMCGCGTDNASVPSGASDPSGGAAEYEPHKANVLAMDTVMTLTAYGPFGEEALKAAEDEITRLDALFSISSESGDIKKLNDTGSLRVSSDTAALLKRASEIGDMTNGLFDFTVEPVMKAWGFTTQEYRVPDKAELLELIKNVDYSKVELSDDNLVKLPENVEIDLGGIAKGYTSDRIMKIFKEHNVASGIISLGGNVQALGAKPDKKKWRVLIEQPREAVFEIEDKAVITSGDYERNFIKDGTAYHHIIDPRSGYPSNSGLTSVTIVSDDGTLADGLSTALFIMGLEKASAFWREHRELFDAAFMDKSGGIYITEGLEGSFTVRDGSLPEIIRA